ncbi:MULTISPECIES: tetratricopeptide repeat protein [unclassified Microbacterium]|uniref:tetratricopeptide repeat protein n=1 Tax=unclassified Microbacterium TaxID=2609290 RepID=UPI00109CE05A|nr:MULTISPECIES: tetratricopeptide repeat protein [unclassified Microbacterium]
MPAPRTLDELCAGLGRMRTDAGSPSYAEIARRIGRLRGGAEPAKVTVYDCFRPGRRRVDDRLVGDIVRALGGEETDSELWRETARVLNGERSGVHIEVAHAARNSPGAEIGREALLASVPAADVLVLTGLPGSGKSTFASALVGTESVLTVQLRESEPDRPHADPIDIMRRMLGALGVRSLPYELPRLRETLQLVARGTTVIVEDAGDARRLAALIVPGVRFLVTSRVDLAELEQRLRPLTLTVARVVVPPMTDADAQRLLSHLIPEEGTEPLAGSDVDVRAGALRRIVAVGGGLPLDLVMLAGIVREHEGWSFQDLASRFEHEPRDARIRPVLEAATRSLSQSEADLLADAALLDRDIDAEVLLAAGGPSAEADLRRLHARHLVELRDGHLYIHATVLAFAAERSRSLRPSSERQAFVRKAAAAAVAKIRSDPDYAAREVVTVLAVAAAAREHAADSAVEQLAIEAHPGLSRWSLWNESLRLHDLAARGEGLDLVPEIALGVAHCAEKLGRLDEALITLHRVRRIATGASLARTWNQIGNVQRWMSHLDEALRSYEVAIGHARAAGDRIVEGRATGNHADTLRILARYPEARDRYAVALRMAQEEGDDLNVAVVRGNLPLLLLATGQLDDAADELQELLDESSVDSLPFVRRTLALVAEATGDDERARELCATARQALQTAGEFATSADLDLLEARMDGRAGDFVSARSIAERTLREAERAGSPLIATEAANSLAEILARAAASDSTAAHHLLDDAERHAAEARSIAEATGDRAEVARSDAVLSSIAALRGDHATAEILAAASTRLYAEIRHRLRGA